MTVSHAGATLQRLDVEAWSRRADAHKERMLQRVGPHLERQHRGIKHPVYDFLFEYYSFRPSHLLRWSPGTGCILDGAAARAFLDFTGFVELDDGVVVDPALLPSRRRDALAWVVDLLENLSARAPRFGCHGLHEWAMVYDPDSVRHSQVPLRMEQDALRRFVDSQPICCSHYDAFRFFSPGARALNRLQPAAHRRAATEQPACLHANMDLYKWAYKFFPWTPSDLLADAFVLAVEIREVDMRASPYDLRGYGFGPICVETEEGRAEYRAHQEFFADRARLVRARLLTCFRLLLEDVRST